MKMSASSRGWRTRSSMLPTASTTRTASTTLLRWAPIRPGTTRPHPARRARATTPPHRRRSRTPAQPKQPPPSNSPKFPATSTEHSSPLPPLPLFCHSKALPPRLSSHHVNSSRWTLAGQPVGVTTDLRIFSLAEVEGVAEANELKIFQNDTVAVEVSNF